ncbi:MAG: insulinase family protein [Candidatus Rokubacteria bacterium]|nr:insulinase family protein [Candidatus Rokubacteria bacterium]MBI2554207.1 insulinase family protein [Candidatus Rokubacteria bacterium]
MRRFVAAFLAVLLALPALAAEPLAAQRQGLPNGAVLLVAERPAIPIVVLRVYLPAGSAFDPPQAPGLANLTAELLSRGTARRAGPALDEAIEFVGGSLEASAGRDGATVSLAVLKKDLGLGLDLLSEVLTQPTFPADELARKVKEIQAAIRRSEENPESVASRALGELLYPGHPYGHPVTGTVESVGKLTREQVLAFYRAHYRPDRAILVVAGDVKADEIRQELLHRLASWSAGGAPSRPPQAPAGPPARSRTIKRELTQVTILLGRPAVGHAHPDYYPLVVASYILGGGSASRLYTRVREEQGLAYDVSSHLAVGRYGATLLISLQTRTDGVAEASRLVREEIARLGKEPVPDADLARAKAYLIGSFPLRMDTTAKVAGLLQTVEEYGLGLDYPARYRQAIGKVRAADIQRVARRYLDPSGFSSVTVGNLPSP